MCEYVYYVYRIIVLPDDKGQINFNEEKYKTLRQDLITSRTEGYFHKNRPKCKN